MELLNTLIKRGTKLKFGDVGFKQINYKRLANDPTYYQFVANQDLYVNKPNEWIRLTVKKGKFFDKYYGHWINTGESIDIPVKYLVLSEQNVTNNVTVVQDIFFYV